MCFVRDSSLIPPSSCVPYIVSEVVVRALFFWIQMSGTRTVAVAVAPGNSSKWRKRRVVVAEGQ